LTGSIAMPPSPVISRYETRRSFRPHHVVQSQNTGIGLCADGYLDLLDEFQLGPPGERGDADGTRRMGTTTVILRGICSVGFSRFQTTQVLLHRSISKSELHWSLTLPRLPLCTHYLQPHLMPEAPFQGSELPHFHNDLPLSPQCPGNTRDLQRPRVNGLICRSFLPR
jgi:hypothetical protein